MSAELVNARQVLRWAIKDHPASPGTHALVETALNDVDWELRATALLAVGLLDITGLRRAVRHIPFKPGPPDGPTTADAKRLAEWRDAIADGAPVENPTPRDHETLLLHALLEPLAPSEVPHRAGYRFIAAEPHWLGDARIDMRYANPIRLVTPPSGFWMSEDRVGCATFEDARAEAEKQSRASGLPVRLPAPDEWEMAARATDGRLFPWGNGYQPGCPELPSPWGLTGLMRGRGEWCQGRVLCGAGPRFGAAARVEAPPEDAVAGYRFVVSFES